MTEIFDEAFIERLPEDTDTALVAIADRYWSWRELNDDGQGPPGTETDHRVAVLFLRRFAEVRVPELLKDRELQSPDTETWYRYAQRAFNAARSWGQRNLDERRVGTADRSYRGRLASLSDEKARSSLGRIESGPTAEPANAAADRIWTSGFFRLFISHTATHKRAATALKDILRVYGVTGFVAHEDIEINLEWQEEIESALASAHALLALLTDDFHGSKWTDQEIGWALGRGLRVLSVNVGALPYGFLGKFQAFGPGKIGVETKMEAIAELVLDTLVRDYPSRVSRSMAGALNAAQSFKEATALLNRLRCAPYADAEMIQSVETAFRENGQCARLFNAEDRRDSLIHYLKTKGAATTEQ